MIDQSKYNIYIKGVLKKMSRRFKGHFRGLNGLKLKSGRKQKFFEIQFYLLGLHAYFSFMSQFFFMIERPSGDLERDNICQDLTTTYRILFQELGYQSIMNSLYI